MRLNKNNRKAFFLLAGAALVLSSAQASADIASTAIASNLSFNKLSWSGDNNGNRGWMDASSWYNFGIAQIGRVTVIATTVSAADLNQAFSIWDVGSSTTAKGSGYGNTLAASYVQTSDEVFGTGAAAVNANFVGFSNYNGPNGAGFGYGPGSESDPLFNAVATHGVNTDGTHWVALSFDNLVAGERFAIAAGGSGNLATSTSNSSGSAGKMNISYSLTSVSNVPAAVPVPGAVWLFGTAVAGMIGIGRRKASISA